jgi:hypothetical protein
MNENKEHGIPVTAPDMVTQKGDVTKKENHYEMAENIERVLSPNDDMDKNYMNYDRVDPDIAKYATANGIEISEEESRRLKRMIDKRVLTVMVFTYFLQALDKGTMSFASIMNIRQDLNLVGQQVRFIEQNKDTFLTIEQYSWLTTCIYIAVLIVEYPTNYLIQRLPVAKYLSINIMLWGAVLALHAVSRNFTTIVALRTLLGIFEAVCQPTFLILSR